MIPKLLRLMGIMLILLFESCAPEIRYLLPTGDDIEVQLTDSNLIRGELLMVTDSAIFVVVAPPPKYSSGNAVYELNVIPVPQIKKLTIKGYSNRKWRTSIVAFELVPAILLGLAAASADAENPMAVTGIVSIPTIFSLALLSAGTPAEPGVYPPITRDQLNGIRKYAHFPQELTAGEFELYASQRNFSRRNY
jgi:hypothetical protein